MVLVNMGNACLRLTLRELLALKLHLGDVAAQVSILHLNQMKLPAAVYNMVVL